MTITGVVTIDLLNRDSDSSHHNIEVEHCDDAYHSQPGGCGWGRPTFISNVFHDITLTNRINSGFHPGFTAGGVRQVKGHVSLDMFWKYPTNGKDLRITKAS